MAALVVTNDWLALRCAAAAATLNAGHILRLFSNDVNPTPASAAPSLVEATYDTYLAISLSGQWSAAAFVMDGLYQSSTGPHTFLAPLLGSQTIYGFFVTFGSAYRIAQRFAAPVAMTAGGPTLQLSIVYQDFARSILPA